MDKLIKIFPWKKLSLEYLNPVGWPQKNGEGMGLDFEEDQQVFELKKSLT